ncbi:Rossmann-like and DUF2520 domain-containing protein [Flagellimonas sp.]|uniref:Rossmann-like and DUF2520 domain-containing protein n=1 Tax=Flagellimonas sp. TaxID=2058762 RepID=UPI003BAFD9A3
MISVVILGTGNMAQHLCQTFSKTDSIQLIQVYGRNQGNLRWFFSYAELCSEPKDIAKADVYLIAVSDQAIEEVSGHLLDKKGIVAHTSGATPMNILSAENRGVFYPLQTFTKDKTVDFDSIPICLEAQNEESLGVLQDLAQAISSKVHLINTEQRRQLHLAAVFTNNFTNYLYGIGEAICKRNKISFDLLKPLIQETSNKIMSLPPKEAQTGPARRGDEKSMNQHLSLMSDRTEQEIYRLLSKAIKTTYEKEL